MTVSFMPFWKRPDPAILPGMFMRLILALLLLCAPAAALAQGHGIDVRRAAVSTADDHYVLTRVSRRRRSPAVYGVPLVSVPGSISWRRRTRLITCRASLSVA